MAHEWLYPGAKVVFVGGRGVTAWYTGWRRFIPGLNKTRLTHNLVANETYTVQSVRTHNETFTGEQIVCAYLVGFRFREIEGMAFPAEWFRPVQYRDTSATVAEIIRKSHETPADLELV